VFERFTERARRVAVLAQEEARMLNHNYIGTEHILLGLIREGEGVAAQVLQKLGDDLNRVRQTVIQLLSGYTGGKARPRVGEEAAVGTFEEITRPAETSAEDFPTCPTCFAPLAETLTEKRIVAGSPEGEGSMVAVLYRARCGAAIGVLP
jgi:ATP-dependent Clp protease ATP-binding subunit ClpA